MSGGCIQYLQLLHLSLTVANRMKRKFYSWEECMNLREVKVRIFKKNTSILCPLQKKQNTISFLTHISWGLIELNNYCRSLCCHDSHWRSSTTPTWWNWRRWSERTITSTSSLSTWRRTSTSWWRTGETRIGRVPQESSLQPPEIKKK